MPESEQQLRKKLGDATLQFVVQIMKMAADDMETHEPDADRVVEFDEPKRRHVTEIYRQAVEEAAAQGIETALAWQTLAVWTDEGKQRIGYFAARTRLRGVRSRKSIHAADGRHRLDRHTDARRLPL